MKNKIIIISLLLASRLLDLTTTFYAGGINLKGETSLVVSRFDLGWKGLIIYNVIIFFCISLLVFFNLEHFFIKKEKEISGERSFHDYLSVLFFNKKISFVKMLTSSKFNMSIYFHVLLYSLPLSVIIFGIIASINNILVSNNIELLKHINHNIFAYATTLVMLLMIVSIQIRYLYRRYKQTKQTR